MRMFESKFYRNLVDLFISVINLQKVHVGNSKHTSSEAQVKIFQWKKKLAKIERMMIEKRVFN